MTCRAGMNMLLSCLVLSSTGIGVRTKRSKNSVNQSRRSGCSLGTCTVHDLAHRLHQLNNKLKVGSAPIDKISPLGYGRRRRSVPERQMRLEMQGGHLQPAWRLHKLEALLRRTWAGRGPRGLERWDFSCQEFSGTFFCKASGWDSSRGLPKHKKTTAVPQALWMRDRNRGDLWWSTETFWVGMQVCDWCTDPQRSGVEWSGKATGTGAEEWTSSNGTEFRCSSGGLFDWDCGTQMHSESAVLSRKTYKQTLDFNQLYSTGKDMDCSCWGALKDLKKKNMAMKLFSVTNSFLGHCMRDECFRFRFDIKCLSQSVKDCYATWTLLLLFLLFCIEICAIYMYFFIPSICIYMPKKTTQDKMLFNCFILRTTYRELFLYRSKGIWALLYMVCCISFICVIWR